MKRFLVVVVALGVTLTGCAIGLPSSPGHKKQSTGTTDPASPFISTSTTIPYSWPPKLNSVTSDVDKAVNVSAVQTDFPAGWNANSLNATTSPNDQAIDEAFVQCLFGTNPNPLSAYAVSPVMASAEGNTIAQSFVRVVGTQASAKADFSNFKPARVQACESAMYERQFSFKPDAQIIGKKFGYSPPDSIPADTLLAPDNSKDVIGIRFLVAPRDAPSIYQDVYAYGIGRFEVVMLFQDSKQNPDSAMEASAITQIKARTVAAAKG